MPASVPTSWYLILSAILFGLGVAGFIYRRNIITVFMSIELTSSIINVPRFLKTVKIIASPTAASAAATTITKKLKICPSTCFSV